MLKKLTHYLQAMTNGEAMKVRTMRNNHQFNNEVNKGLIMSKFRGSDQARRMMAKAGLPTEVIDRVLGEPKKIRRFDWR